MALNRSINSQVSDILTSLKENKATHNTIQPESNRLQNEINRSRNTILNTRPFDNYKANWFLYSIPTLLTFLFTTRSSGNDFSAECLLTSLAAALNVAALGDSATICKNAASMFYNTIQLKNARQTLNAAENYDANIKQDETPAGIIASTVADYLPNEYRI